MLVPAIPARPASRSPVDDAHRRGARRLRRAYASPTARVEYRVADDEDLAAVVEQFAAAADRCRRAGIDGVELHAGHGYLVDEFLSPSINDRTDAWGGDVDGRARLLLEIIRATRARVGDFPLWMRINAVEHHKPNGEVFDDQLAVIERAVAAGLDAVHVTAYASMDVATGPTDSYAPHRVGDLSEYARARARRGRRPRHHVRTVRARRGRAGARRGSGRLRGDGSQAARRSRAAEQARPGRRGPHPSVPLPVPLHRQHLRERVARVRRQRGDRTRGRRRPPGAGPSPARARRRCRRGRARDRARARRCRATPSRCATGPTPAGGVLARGGRRRSGARPLPRLAPVRGRARRGDAS